MHLFFLSTFDNRLSPPPHSHTLSVIHFQQRDKCHSAQGYFRLYVDITVIIVIMVSFGYNKSNIKTTLQVISWNVIFFIFFFQWHSNKVEELPCKNPVPPCWWLSVAGLSSRYRLQFFQTPQTLVLRGGVVFLCLFQRAAAVSADLLPGGRISISGLNQGGQINHSKSSPSWTCAMICVILSGSRRRAY